MDPTRHEQLIRGLAAGADPSTIVAAALAVPTWQELLGRAAALAVDTRDRQVVAVADAYLRGDPGRALLLARDHLADHPASVLVAHIAALTSTEKRNP